MPCRSVATVSPTASDTSRSTQPQPVSSVATLVTVARKAIVSPGNTEPFMRKVMRPNRPFGPVQSVM